MSKTPGMNSFKEFKRNFVLTERRAGNEPTELDITRAYNRLLKITGETAKP